MAVAHRKATFCMTVDYLSEVKLPRGIFHYECVYTSERITKEFPNTVSEFL